MYIYMWALLFKKVTLLIVNPSVNQKVNFNTVNLLIL